MELIHHASIYHVESLLPLFEGRAVPRWWFVMMEHTRVLWPADEKLKAYYRALSKLNKVGLVYATR